MFKRRGKSMMWLMFFQNLMMDKPLATNLNMMLPESIQRKEKEARPSISNQLFLKNLSLKKKDFEKILILSFK